MAALVGVQPKFTQEPPRSLRSASATRLPAPASPQARGIPACPPPMMNTSYVVSVATVFLLRKISPRLSVERHFCSIGSQNVSVGWNRIGRDGILTLRREENAGATPAAQKKGRQLSVQTEHFLSHRRTTAREASLTKPARRRQARRICSTVIFPMNEERP